MAKKRTKPETRMFHLRIPTSLYDRLEKLSGQVTGATVAGLGRALLERGVETAEENPKRELIRDAS